LSLKLFFQFFCWFRSFWVGGEEEEEEEEERRDEERKLIFDIGKRIVSSALNTSALSSEL
jgi:hypothetical protein